MSELQAPDQQMNAGQKLWAYRLAIGWFFLFSVNALCTAVIAALTGAEWALLTPQKKIMICVAITGNWTGTIMAYVSKAAKKVEDGQVPDLANGSPSPDSGGTIFLKTQQQPTTPKTT